MTSQTVVTRLTNVEVWDLHAYLAGTISNAIWRLREAGHSHPVNLTEDQWHDILTRIAEGFASYYVAYEAGEDPERPTEALNLLSQHWLDLWD
jgi:hypothetical protein